MSSFWSTLLLVATGAAGCKDFIYDVSFFVVLATGCYRCYGCNRSQQVGLCYQTLKVPCHCLLQVLIMLKFAHQAGFISC